MSDSQYSVSVKVEKDEITAYLAQFTESKIRAILQRANTVVGKAGEKAALSAYDSDSFPTSKTGNLRRSIGHKRIKANRAIGMVVGPFGQRGSSKYKGFHRHFLEMGTKPHRIRSGWQVAQGVTKEEAATKGAIKHPGAKANPWMTPNRDRIAKAAADAATAFWAKELLPK